MPRERQNMLGIDEKSKKQILIVLIVLKSESKMNPHLAAMKTLKEKEEKEKEKEKEKWENKLYQPNRRTM